MTNCQIINKATNYSPFINLVLFLFVHFYLFANISYVQCFAHRHTFAKPAPKPQSYAINYVWPDSGTNDKTTFFFAQFHPSQLDLIDHPTTSAYCNFHLPRFQYPLYHFLKDLQIHDHYQQQCHNYQLHNYGEGANGGLGDIFRTMRIILAPIKHFEGSTLESYLDNVHMTWHQTHICVAIYVSAKVKHLNNHLQPSNSDISDQNSKRFQLLQPVAGRNPKILT